MKNPKKRDSKRTTVIWTVACAVGVFIVGASTVGNNATSMWNNINNNKTGSPTASIGPATPSRQPSPVSNQQRGRKQVVPTARVEPKFQASTGEQSPNLNDVHGSVRLQYDVPGKPHAQNLSSSPKNPSALVIADSRAAVQISTGGQSPNISGVGKDVDMKFISTPTTESKKD